MEMTSEFYGKLLVAARNITNNHQDHEELLQECMVALYEKDKDFIQELHDNKSLQFYCVRIMLNMWNSSTSSYHLGFKRNSCLNSLKVFLMNTVQATKMF